MADEVKQQTETVAEQAKTETAKPEVKAEEFDKERAMATIEKLRGFEKEAEKLKKKVADYEARDKERQDAELSETEKLKKQLAEAQAKVKQSEFKELQRQAATNKQLDLAFADRLRGETLEALEADAEQFLAKLPKAGKQTTGNATNPGSNASGGETDEQRLARLHGRGVNIFDPVLIKKQGGGVNFITSNEE